MIRHLIAALFTATTLAACSNPAADEQANAAANAATTDVAVAGPDSTIATETAQDRADRLNAQQDAAAPELDENGDPIPAAPNAPTMEEMERAVAKAEEAESSR